MFDKKFEEEQLSVRKLQSFLNYFHRTNVIEKYFYNIWKLQKNFALYVKSFSKDTDF
jgi:hypothetical protein